MQLLPATIKCLKAAGWYAGRAIDVSLLLDSVRLRGYQPQIAGEAFLREYGMLIIPQVPTAFGARPTKIVTHPDDALNSALADWMDIYTQVIKEDLMPLGTSGNRHEILMVSRAGTFYGGAELALARLGYNAIDTMNALCTTGHFEHIEIPDELADS